MSMGRKKEISFEEQAGVTRRTLLKMTGSVIGLGLFTTLTSWRQVQRELP